MILAAAACTAGPVAGSFSKTQLEIAVFDGVIAEQPSSLAQEALGAGRRARSSRDIDLAGAEHSRIFPMERRLQKMTLRANKRETTDWLKFTLEGAGERTHGYAFTDTTFAGCWI
jgi:hypothetical protein